MRLLCLTALLLALSPASGALVHRWSFDTDGSDSVGAAHAVMMNGATVSDGQLQLNGAGAYATLPIDSTLAGLGSATIEAWVTHDQLTSWPRVFDFGNGNATGNPTQGYLFLTASPQYSSIVSYAQFSITRTGNTASENIYAGAVPGPGVELHLAVVLDADAGMGLVYLNGTLLLKGPLTLKPSDIVSVDGQEHNWPGRSRYSSNSSLKGSINESRIHDTALSPAEILVSHHLGPSAPPDATSLHLLNPAASPGAFSFQMNTVTGLSYAIQYTDSLAPLDWRPLTALTGNNSVQTVMDNGAPQTPRFYRAEITESQ